MLYIQLRNSSTTISKQTIKDHIASTEKYKLITRFKHRHNIPKRAVRRV